MKLPIKRAAVINDFSGFGRCSISVALPILSAMGVQCCSLPTAILSNHTGYSDYFFDSYTQKMPEYIGKWEKLGLEFDSIFSGFLGCKEQIEIVSNFIRDFRTEGCHVIVDPVMGDNGKIYTTYTAELCEKMRDLTELADIITPNITEACILAGETYRGEEISEAFTRKLLDSLCNKGERSVLITGVIDGENVNTCIFDKDSKEIHTVKNRRIKKVYPGTGDLFASVLCGAVTNGSGLLDAARLAADFVEKTTEYTSRYETNPNDGIAFEPYLYKLANKNQ
ncbi:MAG: pyridoxamine kinase [Oscillospiraceae bacterium]|nr:pyridoxamine kinase [Oscillospiraceae bacterium]